MPPKESPQDYGPYVLESAQLISLPQLTSKGTIDWFGAPPTDRVANALEADGPGGAGGPGGTVLGKRKALGDIGMAGTTKKRKTLGPPPPRPVDPNITSVAVMDVGQGNCNVLIEDDDTPVTYYDVGYPLPFFVSSLPLNMRRNDPAYLGPYQPTSLNNMNVVLSHWDWDHWRLGHVANLQNLDWTYPNQAMGPATANFVNGLANGNVYPAAAPPGAGVNYVILPCTPLPGMPPAALMNNSGLALATFTRIPSVVLPHPNLHLVVLTADANFNTLAGVVNPAAPAFPFLVAATAVHHGSNNYGAPNNLPAPVIPDGRIVYSYGVSGNTGNHPYGFPGNVAVGNYQAAAWGANPANARSTAEGPNIHPVGAGPLPPPPPVVRGNVRIGDQTPLPYANTAFTTFPVASQLV